MLTRRHRHSHVDSVRPIHGLVGLRRTLETGICLRAAGLSARPTDRQQTACQQVRYLITHRPVGCTSIHVRCAARFVALRGER